MSLVSPEPPTDAYRERTSKRVKRQSDPKRRTRAGWQARARARSHSNFHMPFLLPGSHWNCNFIRRGWRMKVPDLFTLLNFLPLSRSCQGHLDTRSLLVLAPTSRLGAWLEQWKRYVVCERTDSNMGLCGSLTTLQLCCQPLDTIKVRMQLSRSGRTPGVRVRTMVLGARRST